MQYWKNKTTGEIVYTAVALIRGITTQPTSESPTPLVVKATTDHPRAVLDVRMRQLVNSNAMRDFLPRQDFMIDAQGWRVLSSSDTVISFQYKLVPASLLPSGLSLAATAEELAPYELSVTDITFNSNVTTRMPVCQDLIDFIAGCAEPLSLLICLAGRRGYGRAVHT